MVSSFLAFSNNSERLLPLPVCGSFPSSVIGGKIYGFSSSTGAVSFFGSGISAAGFAASGSAASSDSSASSACVSSTVSSSIIAMGISFSAAGVSFLGTTVLPMSSSGRISMLMLSSRGFSAKISANNASAASDSVACGFTCSSAASFRTSSAGIAAASRIEGVSAAFSSCASFGASSVFSSLRTATSAPFSFTKSKIGSRFFVSRIKGFLRNTVSST